ncbi:MAG: hypothetical protein NUW22_15560 [Acidobacteria bacterium]|nr:hypothetical protein [Acidobacteriota bacterium]
MADAKPTGSYTPADREVEALITAATRHPLGTEFLVGGYLGTVAITFRVHAFVVEAARLRLRGPSDRN